MAFVIPPENNLTDSQSEVLSKINSMQGLLNLRKKPKFLSKDIQITTYDYLKKLTNVIGIAIEPMFYLFINKIFDQTNGFLEDKIFKSIASDLATKGISLPSETVNSPNAKQVREFEKINFQYIKSLVPSNFLSVAKQQMAKDLYLLIFGPKDGQKAEYLNPDPIKRQFIIDNAVCGYDAFTISTPQVIKDQTVEYNRAALKKQLEKGEVIFEISCQSIKIKLPEDPRIFFEGGGIFSIPSQIITPAQSIRNLVQYTSNQIQNINNQNNDVSGGKNFLEIMIEKIIGDMTTLIYFNLSPIFDILQNAPASSNYTQQNIVFSNCQLLNSDEQTLSQNKRFGEKLANYLYKALIAIMLTTIIREFKKLLKNYCR